MISMSSGFLMFSAPLRHCLVATNTREFISYAGMSFGSAGALACRIVSTMPLVVQRLAATSNTVIFKVHAVPCYKCVDIFAIPVTRNSFLLLTMIASGV